MVEKSSLPNAITNYYFYGVIDVTAWNYFFPLRHRRRGRPSIRRVVGRLTYNGVPWKSHETEYSHRLGSTLDERC